MHPWCLLSLVSLLSLLFPSLCAQAHISNMRTISTRLTPGQDIITELMAVSKSLRLRAVSVLSAVGSVTSCSLRLANNSYLTPLVGPMEIVSLSGTMDQHQNPHIHVSLSDSRGVTLGGHLPSLEQRQGIQSGCQIFTTLELVLAEHSDLVYRREIDGVTTFDELVIFGRGTWRNGSLQG